MTSIPIAGSGTTAAGGILGFGFPEALDRGVGSTIYQVEAVELYGWSLAYTCLPIEGSGDPCPPHQFFSASDNGWFDYPDGAYYTVPPLWVAGGDVHNGHNILGHWYSQKAHRSNRDCFQFEFSKGYFCWQNHRAFAILDPALPGGNLNNTYGIWTAGDCARLKLMYKSNWEGGPWDQQDIEDFAGSTSIGGDPRDIDVGVYMIQSATPMKFPTNVGLESVFSGDDLPHAQWNDLFHAPTVQGTFLGTWTLPVAAPGRERTEYFDVPAPPPYSGTGPKPPFIAYALIPFTGYDASYGGNDGPMSYAYSGPTQAGWPIRGDTTPRVYDFFNSSCLFFGGVAFSFPNSYFVYVLEFNVQRLPYTDPAVIDDPTDFATWPCNDQLWDAGLLTPDGTLGSHPGGGSYVVTGNPSISPVPGAIRLHITGPTTIELPFTPSTAGVFRPWDQAAEFGFPFSIDNTQPYIGSTLTLRAVTPNGYSGGGSATIIDANTYQFRGILDTGPLDPRYTVDTAVDGTPWGFAGQPAPGLGTVGGFSGYTTGYMSMEFDGFFSVIGLDRQDPSNSIASVPSNKNMGVRQLINGSDGFPVYDPGYYSGDLSADLSPTFANRLVLSIVPASTLDITIFGFRISRFGAICPDTGCHAVATIGAVPAYGARKPTV